MTHRGSLRAIHKFSLECHHAQWWCSLPRIHWYVVCKTKFMEKRKSLFMFKGSVFSAQKNDTDFAEDIVPEIFCKKSMLKWTNTHIDYTIFINHLADSQPNHYIDVIMGTMASHITSLTIVYSTVYSYADQRKHQSSAPLAFVWEIHRSPVNSPHKWPVTRKMFPFDDVIICSSYSLSFSVGDSEYVKLTQMIHGGSRKKTAIYNAMSHISW